jgi:hypothetical protein
MRSLPRPRTTLPRLAAFAGAAISAATSADVAGFVAFSRNVGSSTVIDVYAAVTASSDRFLNVFNAKVASTTNFVQKTGLATKTWKPDMAGFGSTRDTADDSFMTAGTFGGGEYGGEYYASSNSIGDPNFTGTSWTSTPASAAAVTVPADAGWFTGDPTSADNAPQSLASIAGTRIDSIRVSGSAGSGTSNAAQFGIWVGHLVVTGTDRTIGEGASVTWDASVSIKTGAGATQQGRFKLVPATNAAPTNVSATDGSSTAAVTVTWTAASNATGYKVLRAQGSAAAAQIGTTAAGVVTYTDSAATAGIAYNYSVKASYASGDSAASTADAGWRNILPPSGVSATDGTSASGVTVTWNASAGATGYAVFRAQGAGPASEVGVTTASVRTFTDTAGEAATAYTYTVKATTAAGSSASSAGDAGWRNLSAPTGVAASDGTSTGSVTVTWAAASGANGYKVFRAVGAGATTQIGTTAASIRTFTDTTANAGVTYTYSVKATSSLGDSAASATNTGWRNVTPPAPAATDGTSAAHVTVSWAASSSHTGYKVFRGVGSATPTQLGTALPSTASSYNDATGTPGISYNYYVKAMTAAGDSALSAANAGWRGLAAPASISATDGTSTASVTVTWNAVTGATGYKVLRATGSAAAVQIGTTAGSVRTFTDATAAVGVTYSYAVKASAAMGDGPAGTPNAGWRNVAAPVGVAASDGTFTAHVRVTWTASTNTAVTGYRVLRKIGSAAETSLATVTGRTTAAYNDTTIPVGSVGTYRVAALTAAGASSPSTTNTGFKKNPSGMPTGDDDGEETPSGGDGTAAGAASTGPTGATSRGAVAGLRPPVGAGSVAAAGGAPSAGPAPRATSIAAAFLPPTCDTVAARVHAFRAWASDGEVSAAIDSLLAPAGLSTDAGHDSCVACRLLTGDVTLDGTVGADDAVAWIGAWADGDWTTADLDRDGWVDDRDLSIILRATWGTSAQP